MSPDLLKAFYRSGVFVFFVALALVFATPRDSAEFVVSVCSLAIGATLIGLVALVNRLTQ